jgi:hypothetical protein
VSLKRARRVVNEFEMEEGQKLSSRTWSRGRIDKKFEKKIQKIKFEARIS